MTIKAIETVYNGYRFRSRLEARWAVFFDVLGLPYDYEPEGYDLGELGWYLPDFWLSDWECWIEVKPTAPSTDDLAKIINLAQQRNESGFLLFGSPGKLDVDVDVDTGLWQLNRGALMVGYLPGHDQDGEPMILYDPTIRAWAEIDGGTVLDIWPYYSSQLPVLGFWSDTISMPLCVAPRFPSGLMYRGYGGAGIDYYTDRLATAYQEARGARFEHGETPR